MSGTYRSGTSPRPATLGPTWATVREVAPIGNDDVFRAAHAFRGWKNEPALRVRKPEPDPEGFRREQFRPPAIRPVSAAPGCRQR